LGTFHLLFHLPFVQQCLTRYGMMKSLSAYVFIPPPRSRECQRNILTIPVGGTGGRRSKIRLRVVPNLLYGMSPLIWFQNGKPNCFKDCKRTLIILLLFRVETVFQKLAKIASWVTSLELELLYRYTCWSLNVIEYRP